MDGKEPMYVHPSKPGNAHHTYLDEAGFTFAGKCFQALEKRGTDKVHIVINLLLYFQISPCCIVIIENCHVLSHFWIGLEDQGLYRVVGVTSKVNRLLDQGLDKKKLEKLNFDDAMEVESKTVRKY